jgi:hypothetical protein
MEALYKEFNYPSANKFKQILKQHNILKTKKEIDDFISGHSLQQIHKPVYKVKEKQKFIFSLSPFEMLQIDLLDYQKYSKSNKGNTFILIAVDIFSRKAFAEPIKNKTPKSVLEAYQKFHIKATSLYHDDGKEYMGVFLKYLNDNDIINLTADVGNHNSLGVIDRFSKTFKHMIIKYMEANDTVSYYDAVNKLVDAYNNTPHSSLGDITPNQIFQNQDDYNTVQRINLAKMKYNKELGEKSKKIKVGDKVRIQVKKDLFKKRL